MLKIYTMTHKKFYEPEDKLLYIPLHVGHAASKDIGYLGDDTGDNISLQNPYYGELTGVYWVWKNEKEADYVGVCHYRRFFVNQSRKLLNKEEYTKILRENDIVVSTAMQAEGSYESYYGEAHNINDLYAVGRAIKKCYPSDYPIFQKMIQESVYYYGNLMVTSKKLFDAYAEWLFTILGEAAKEIDVHTYDLYNKRVFGFLSEQLLRVWVVARKLTVYECPIGVTAEKAETVELKLALSQLVKQGKITQARELFYECIKIRPDVQLELSDIKGELPIIEQLLCVMEQEQLNGLEGIYTYSSQLSKQIIQYKELVTRMKNCREQPFDTQTEYLNETKVSCFLVFVILLNQPFSEEEKQRIVLQIKNYFIKRGRLAEAEVMEEILEQ